MEDKSLEFLTEEELAFVLAAEQCQTIGEAMTLNEKASALNDCKTELRYIDMPLEEFKKRYGFIDIKDLKGKYGF